MRPSLSRSLMSLRIRAIDTSVDVPVSDYEQKKGGPYGPPLPQRMAKSILRLARISVSEVVQAVAYPNDQRVAAVLRSM
jgi:hypothetical protein